MALTAFQGGVPGVADNASSGMRVIQATQPRYNYESVMANALKPINAAADTVSKVLEIEANRTIKAESDDAENRVVETINRYMLGENGYLSQSGKNAMDSFDSTMSNLNGDVQKILGGISPQAQEAIKSRVADRLESTRARAMTHRGQQTNAYHLKSAESRLDMLIEDVAANHSDVDAYSRSMASMDNEIDYICELRGLPGEAKTKMKSQYYSLAQARRLQEISKQDPVEALNQFQQLRDAMDFDVASKLDNGLFNESQHLLSEMVKKSQTSRVQLPNSIPEGVSANVAATRGFNANNPLDIRKGKDVWVGQVEGKDPAFVTFETPEAGIRAAVKLLQTYKKQGKTTITDILEKFAPATENETGRYIKNVSEWTGFAPDEQLDTSNPEVANKLIRAMMKQEIGGVPYSDDVIARGVSAGLGGKYEPVTSEKKKPYTFDPDSPTGIPIIDNLSYNQKLKVLQGAMRARSEEITQAKRDLVQAQKDSYAQISQYGTDPNELTVDQFVSVYGQEDGVKLFNDYHRTAEVAAATHNVALMDNESQDVVLGALKPKSGDPDFQQKQKHYEVVAKAVANVRKERTADPVGYAVAHGQMGYEPLDFRNHDKLVQQLSHRAQSANDLASEYGANKAILSTAESKMLIEYLDKSDIDTRVGMLSSFKNAIGMEGISAIAKQLSTGNRGYAIAIAGMNEYPNGSRISTGEKYLRGKDLIARKMVKIDASPDTGVLANINRELGDSADAEGVFTNPEAFSASSEVALGVYAYSMNTGGSTSPSGAISEAIGDVFNHNGKKVILPRGIQGNKWFKKDFGNYVEAKAEEIKKMSGTFYQNGQAMTAMQFGSNLSKMKLRTESMAPDGSVTYTPLYNGSPVINSDGRVFTFTIGGASK